jgi:hypothetical protein
MTLKRISLRKLPALDVHRSHVIEDVRDGQRVRRSQKRDCLTISILGFREVPGILQENCKLQPRLPVFVTRRSLNDVLLSSYLRGQGSRINVGVLSEASGARSEHEEGDEESYRRAHTLHLVMWNIGASCLVLLSESACQKFGGVNGWQREVNRNRGFVAGDFDGSRFLIHTRLRARRHAGTE